jgi:hypothetical protein
MHKRELGQRKVGWDMRGDLIAADIELSIGTSSSIIVSLGCVEGQSSLAFVRPLPAGVVRDRMRHCRRIFRRPQTDAFPAINRVEVLLAKAAFGREDCSSHNTTPTAVNSVAIGGVRQSPHRSRGNHTPAVMIGKDIDGRDDGW